jgi:hypothetical protein
MHPEHFLALARIERQLQLERYGHAYPEHRVISQKPSALHRAWKRWRRARAMTVHPTAHQPA